MSSTTKSKIGLTADNQRHEETFKLVIVRLLWIGVTTIVAWIIVGVIAFMTPFPVETDALGFHQTHALCYQFTAAILIAHIASVLFVQIFAPKSINHARLASNTMFSALVLSLCVSITVVAHIVPPAALPYLKVSFETAFMPPFVMANLFLCGIFGLMIYWSRETKLADMVEIYWSLGLMFLLALSTALVMAVVSI